MHVNQAKILQAPIRPSTPHVARSTQRPRSLDNPHAISDQKNKAATKAHKRYVKHATLLSRLQSTVPRSKVTKRRRPSKKLVTGLEDLGDALPDTNTDGKDSQDPTQSEVKMKQKSLKSRPGALKRKERLLTGERERFAKNLALMALEPVNEACNATSSQTSNAGNPGVAGPNDPSNSRRAKWAAIRAHVGRTMETVHHSNSYR